MVGTGNRRASRGNRGRRFGGNHGFRLGFYRALRTFTPTLATAIEGRRLGFICGVIAIVLMRDGRGGRNFDVLTIAAPTIS
jgi:hypothetical protein